MLMTGMCISKKMYGIYFFIFALGLGFIAFYYSPDLTKDLYRHYKTLENYKIYGFDYFYMFEKSSSLPMYAFYFYIMSLLPYYGFLPAITCFLVYGLNFWVIYRIALKFSLPKSSMLIGVFFIISNLNYIGVISGIRNNLAFTLFFLLNYLELIEKKNKVICWVLMILLGLFHSSIYIVLFCKFIAMIINKYSRKVVYVILAVSSLFGARVVSYVVEKLNFIGSDKIFEDFLWKTTYYLDWTTTNSWYYYRNVMVMFLTVTIFFYFYFKRRKLVQEYRTYVNLFLMLIIITIGFAFNDIVFGRLAIAVCLFSIIPMELLLTTNSNNQNNKFILRVSPIKIYILLECIISLIYYTKLGGWADLILKF